MNMHKGAIVLSKNGKDVIECEHCGFKHINPLPTDQELEQLYKFDYYSTEKPTYLSENTDDKKWWSMVYSERYKLLESKISKPNKTILDIGSGPGFFLLEGKKRGWSTKGLEANLQAYEFSKNLGLDIENKFLNDSNKNEIGNFDVVNMGEVLEHIKDPIGLLEIVYDKLNVNGILLLILPNDFNPFQKILQNNLNFDPWWVVPEHHYNYFDFYSIQNLLQKIGKLNS
jgi:SAM-dependent methyltransferase